MLDSIPGILQGAYDCHCNAGFEFTDDENKFGTLLMTLASVCRDIDECATTDHECVQHAICTNNPGWYQGSIPLCRCSVTSPKIAIVMYFHRFHIIRKKVPIIVIVKMVMTETVLLLAILWMNVAL